MTKVLSATIAIILVASAFYGGFEAGGLLIRSEITADHPSKVSTYTAVQKAAFVLYTTALQTALVFGRFLLAPTVIWLYTAAVGRRYSGPGIFAPPVWCGWASFASWRSSALLLPLLISHGMIDRQLSHAVGAGFLLAILCGGAGLLLLTLTDQSSKGNPRVFATQSVALAGLLSAYLLIAEQLNTSPLLLQRAFLLIAFNILALAAVVVAILIIITLSRRGMGNDLPESAHGDQQHPETQPRLTWVSRVGAASWAVVLLIIVAAGSSAMWESRVSKPGSARGPLRETRSDGLNVLLINIDTLRADHLSCYGYQQPTSPMIDRLAAEGVLFSEAISQSSWTKPSVASLLTSLYPTTHSAQDHGDALPEQASTLAELLKQDGYATGGVVANPQLKKMFGFDQGMDYYCDDIVRDTVFRAALRSWSSEFFQNIARSCGRFFTWADYDTAERLNEYAIPWIEEHADSKFFLYLHYNDPHTPYSPPPTYSSMFLPENFRSARKRNENPTADIPIVSLYDGEIAYVDFHVGRVLETLDKLDLKDRTLVIITADHGEEFWEHGGINHGETLYDEVVHVPLAMRLPNTIPAGLQIVEQVRGVDVMPTILEILGSNVPAEVHGRSLLPLIKDSEEDPPPYAFVELNRHLNQKLRPYDLPYVLRSIRSRSWKFILSYSSPRATAAVELYNLSSDPEEKVNVSETHPKLISQLSEVLLAHARTAQEASFAASKVDIDAGTREQLRSLGYLQ